MHRDLRNALSTLTSFTPLPQLHDTGVGLTNMTWRTAAGTRAQIQAGGPPIDYRPTSRDCALLRDYLAGNSSPSTTEFSRLASKGLVKDALVTDYGLAAAITALPLQEQCTVLGLDYRHVSIQRPADSRPEPAVRDFLKTQQGFPYVSFDEGGVVKFLIQAAGASLLWPLVQDYVGPRAESYFRMLWLPPALHYCEEVCHEVEAARDSDIASGFDFIISCQVDPTLGWLQIDPISPMDVSVVGRAIPRSLLATTFKLLHSDPMAFSWGWPDLSVIDTAGRFRLIEVKTTDRLHLSQVQTMSALRHIGYTVEVWTVR